MKSLFLLLAFLNIVYFFWGLTAGEKKMTKATPAPLYSEGKIEELLLVLDDDIKQDVKPQVAISNAPESVEKTICYMVGDFPTKNAAAQLMNDLRGHAVSVVIAPLGGAEEFWVTYPSSGDWGESLKNVGTLKEKGVTDLWLVPNGAQKGVISLGLFATMDRAESRLQELESKQVEAVIIKREKVRYSVKVEIAEEVQAIWPYLSDEGARKQKSTYEISC